MKKATIIFLILGMVITTVSNILSISPETIIACIITIAFSLVFGGLALLSVFKGKKNIFFGIMALLFSGLIGGILYLCWNPNKHSKFII